MTDEQLTAIYKQANGEDVGKARPLTTQNIFRAMRAVHALATQPTPTNAPAPEAITVLAELVAVEDLKRKRAKASAEWSRLEARGSPAAVKALHAVDDLQTEIARRGPAAWERARSVAAPTPAAPAPSGPTAQQAWDALDKAYADSDPQGPTRKGIGIAASIVMQMIRAAPNQQPTPSQPGSDTAGTDRGQR